MSLTLRTISREQHLAYIQSLPSASHMQVPAWADVKAEWRSESLGWFDEKTGELVGAGLVLYRQLPKIKRYLAYLPEGPVINWFAPNLTEWLEPMLAHLKHQGAFSVKMGPPVIIRRWEATSIKAGIQNPDVKRLRDIEADFIEPRAFEVADKLRRMGWQQGEDGGAGFGDVQPRYVYQVPLANRSLEEVHKNFNQLWRRNIKKAEKAGVEVVQGGYQDLEEWQRLYEITAVRDHFRPRPLSYFQRMWTALNTEDPNRMRLYFARPRGCEPVGGDHADRRRPRLVLLRRLRQHRPRGPALERDAVADAARRLRARRDRLRPAGHLRLAGRDRPPLRSDPVQGGHGRSGGRVPRRVGLPAQQAAPQGSRHLHVAPLTSRCSLQ
ncbi:hypothetical protein M2162_004224 [Streptomyces sp. SAI-041]|nr:hypothetical protein [Streptomyces sp. SAI-041]